MSHCHKEDFNANSTVHLYTASLSLETQYASNALSMPVFSLIPAFLPFYIKKDYNPSLGPAGWIDFFPLKEILSKNLWATIIQFPQN